MEVHTESHNAIPKLRLANLKVVIALLAIVLSGVTQSLSEQVSYAGHSVIRAWPGHDDHVTYLTSLHQQRPHGIEFWRVPTSPAQSVDIRVSGHMKQRLMDRFRRSDLRYEVTVDDLQSEILKEKNSRPDNNSDHPASYNMSIYHTFDEIMSWLDQQSNICGPICDTFIIGNSSEGRPLKVMRLGIPQPGKPVVWIDAGIHAREWIAPSTAVHLIHRFLRDRHSDIVVRYLLNQFTWYVLPIANPDGYVYTWNTDRLWRKTRSRHPNSPCRGADPNRNWNFYWAGPGTSDDPCSENFHGQAPFSEPETRAMSQFLLPLQDHMAIYLTLHSYGQYWLTPWGFTKNLPSDYNDMEEVGNIATAAMRSRAGTEYRVGSSSNLLYLAAGGSDDWAKGVLGVKYSYTVELRDTGKHGFVLPSQFIDTTGEEMFDALRTLATEVNKRRNRLYMKR